MVFVCPLKNWKDLKNPLSTENTALAAFREIFPKYRERLTWKYAVLTGMPVRFAAFLYPPKAYAFLEIAMKFQVTNRINTHAEKEQLLQALEQQFRSKSESLSRNGDAICVKSIEASFGSINRSDKTDVSLRPVDGGYLMVADVTYSPSIWFWVILILTLFTWVFWLVPIVFYLLQKKTVKEGIEECFQNTINQFGAATQSSSFSTVTPPSQDSIADLQRLGNLMQQGLISLEEFNAHKAKVFGIPAVPVAANHQQPPPITKQQIAPNGSDEDSDSEAARMYDFAKRQLASGDKQKAIDTLRSLINRYPNSAAAAKAQRSLAPTPKTSK